MSSFAPPHTPDRQQQSLVFSDSPPLNGATNPSPQQNQFHQHPQHPQHGAIQLIIGPMFAGKSSELLRRIRRYEIAKKACLLIKHKIDERYNNKEFITTHDSQNQYALPLEKLRDATNIMENYDCIGIDEGQFFPDLLEFCEYAANQGKIVIVAALDGTYERKAFSQVVNLIPRAETVRKLKAVCAICLENASFTRRITNDRKTCLVGSTETYQAVCRHCYMNEKNPCKRSRDLSNGSLDDQILDSPTRSLQRLRFTDKEDAKMTVHRSQLGSAQQQ
mmetsp:Transcript_6894/g.25730  ORF Transcript_6894/g.25730 Transcript_6894/m.25730 type:complete len:277 (-) Transcript_6894:39-869(-)|eukprot:CAMPEP_0117440498 /NCGR_PEP_ID=MMETSP0759-20121206/3129_1 /TAXON_ID=63605 /ORGANISM="Percolomonas cosmopolitus, Strain WS" /LENGTH=276 /DNA_ID=CAMNT_0005232281 /DNA_START=54 /DNA_END=884 /DNA_ORIENTATION=-